MDINDILVSDEALAVIDQGTWVDMSDEAPGLELLVCGLRSESARKAIKDKQVIARKKNRGKELTEDQNTSIMKEVLCEVVLKDWRGLKSGGKDLAYDANLARNWIMSRSGERFTELVIAAAQRLDAEADSFVEEVSKN